MKTKRNRMPSRCGRIAVLLALSPMMMLNTSLTLCVGQDGRAAVEIVVLDRCVCEMPAPGAAGTAVDPASRLGEGPGLSCTDLAIPVGACSIRPAPAASQAAVVGLALAPPLPPAPLDEIESTALAPPPAFTCYYSPLNSIILRV